VLNLIITASISTYTYRQGAEQINIPFDLLANYLENLVLPELQDPKLNSLGQLKATCIKFIYMFRNQLPDQFVPVFLDKVADFLKSESYVKIGRASCRERV